MAGCSAATERVERFYDSQLSLDNPIDWWHQLQGGPVAEMRPPPPGASDPYPNLGRVPARPTPTDAATRRALLARLTAERDRTRQLAAEDPISFPGAGAAGKPTGAASAAATQAAPAAAAPVDPDASSMTLDAATATPAAPSPPPRTAVDPSPPQGLAAGPAGSAVAVASGPIPALPGAAPGLPVLPGLPVSVAQPVVPRPRAGAEFRFAAGSAELPEAADAALRALAGRRVGSPVRVVAGGDARSSSPDSQRLALPLALRRTGAITAALIAAGVPSSAIRAEGVALGREASARLVD